MAGSVRTCCIPYCSTTLADNITLHTFPHPEKEKERFMMWVNAVGSDLSKLSHQYIYKYRKICHDHFEERYLTWTKRLSAVAVPTLRIPARLQLKETAVSSRFPRSKETNDFLQKRKEPTEHRQKCSLQKKFIPEDKSSSSNSPTTFETSPLLNTDSINKNPKEKTKVPFDHKHVLKMLHDKQYFCDVCHKRFTRLSPGLHNKHVNVKTEATPVPGASDLTAPFIKQEKEVEYFEDEMENKEDCENEIYIKSEDKYTSNEIKGPSAVELSGANNDLSYNVTIPPAFIQKQEIKEECIEVEVQTKEDHENESTEPVKNILDETSTEQIEHKNVSKKPRTCDKPYSCVCGQKFTCATWLNKHKARYNHCKDNSSDIKKEDVMTEVTSAVASDANDSLVPPALMKQEVKEEYVEVKIEKNNWENITDAE